MADSIDGLALKLTADASEFDKAMDRATGRIAVFSREAVRPLSALQDMGGRAKGIIDPITSALSRFPLLGGGAGGALAAFTSVDGFFGNFRDMTKEILGESRQAEALGLNMREFVGMEIAAGSASDKLRPSLSQLGGLLGAVSQGSEQASLKSRRLGLDGQALSEMPMGQAVARIAGHVRGLGNHFERARLARELFGEGGVEMLPMLARGGAGLQTAQDKGGTGRPDPHRPGDGGAAANERDPEGLRPPRRGLKRMGAIAATPIIKGVNELLGLVSAAQRGPMAFFSAVSDLNRQPEPAKPLTAAEQAAAKRAELLASMGELADRMQVGTRGAGGGAFAEDLFKMARRPGVNVEDLDALANLARGADAATLADKLQQQSLALDDQLKAFGRAFDTAELQAAVRKGGEGSPARSGTSRTG